MAPSPQNNDLLSAVIHGDVAATKTLVKAGADINQENDLGQSPLLLAVICGLSAPHTEIALFLIRQGADFRRHEGEILLRAIDHGAIEVIHLLTEKDVNIKMKDWRGDTPLMRAKRYNRQEIINILEKAEKAAAEAERKKALRGAVVLQRDLRTPRVFKTGRRPKE